MFQTELWRQRLIGVVIVVVVVVVVRRRRGRGSPLIESEQGKEETEHFHAELLRHRAIHDECDERGTDRCHVPEIAEMRVESEELLVDADGDEKETLGQFDEDRAQGDQDEHRRCSQLSLEIGRRTDRRVTTAKTFPQLPSMMNVQNEKNTEDDENEHGKDLQTDGHDAKGDLLQTLPSH